MFLLILYPSTKMPSVEVTSRVKLCFLYQRSDLVWFGLFFSLRCPDTMSFLWLLKHRKSQVWLQKSGGYRGTLPETNISPVFLTPEKRDVYWKPWNHCLPAPIQDLPRDGSISYTRTLCDSGKSQRWLSPTIFRTDAHIHLEFLVGEKRCVFQDRSHVFVLYVCKWSLMLTKSEARLP